MREALDKVAQACYYGITQGRRNYVCRVPVRIIGTLFAVLVAAAMDQYDRASDSEQVRREMAVAHVMALQYAQQLHYEARVALGIGEVCEDCGCAIDGQRRREYPLATVCRECARGEGEV
jgi:hypothetical protein